jgi:hypothetical protein
MEQIYKSTDPITCTYFINSSYIQFQDLHLSKKNQQCLILKIGNRRGPRNYRLYTSQKNNINILRFEAEMKVDLIKDFQNLLIAS